MKKYLLLALCALIAAACTNQYEQNLQRMEEGVKKYFEDEAFKNDGKVEFLELKAVSYDTIDENQLDTFRLNYILTQYEHHKSENDRLIKIIEEQLYRAGLYNSAGMPDIAKHEAKGTDKYFKESEEHAEKMRELYAMDSAIRVGIQNRTNPAIFFRLKYFAKAIFTDKNTGSSNVMDTMYLMFDQKFNVVTISE